MYLHFKHLKIIDDNNVPTITSGYYATFKFIISFTAFFYSLDVFSIFHWLYFNKQN